MLAYVPVTFAVHRPLKPYLRWTLQCLVGFANHSGRCFPSVRKLSEVSDVPRSTVSRHLAELVKCGAITRSRRPGGVYTYQIDVRFLPATRVSHARAAAVPQVRREERHRQLVRLQSRRYAQPGLGALTLAVIPSSL